MKCLVYLEPVDGKSVDFRFTLSLVWRAVFDSSRLEIGCMCNNVEDLLILRSFGIRGRPARVLVFAFQAKLLAASMAVNFAWNFGWHQIWLESDSSYMVQLLSSRSDSVPWRVWQAWNICIYQISDMEFQVSHIFREGDHVTVALYKHSLGLEVDSWWFFAPPFRSSLVGNDCMGNESFRFS
ncbi:hypothetical protein Dsin_028528 [Dipteronia sinensis]|uniref:RNase H type-1 domain-containing protein n=1 Tax=Dipteronia sinensis TaxID=43782 RepID=A0AAE0DVM6_9ROSI|nr:hypothetical protein Dsin_028528 [Dipteronia sinensis]